MILRILAFLAVVVLLTGLIHGYLWARLVRDPGWPAPWRLAGTVALVSFAVAIPGAFLFRSVLPGFLSTALTWGGYIWMGVMFYLLVLLLPFEIPRFALRVRGEPFDGERRLLLARAVGVVVSAATAGVSSLGMASALSRARVKRVPITLSKLPASLDGFRIVQLTDVHVGPTIGRDFIEEIVATTNGLTPDLIAITGDLVDGPVSRLASLVAPLQGLRARHGVFFVTGNHEYYAGADDWLKHLATLGITPLRNERVSIDRNGHGFDLAGVDDYSVSAGGRHVANLARALSHRDTRRPTVLLAHQPRGIHDAAAQGVDLQLSGHTHGGQIFPFGFLTRLVQPVLSGHARFGGTQIYVSNGTGYWGPPMRVGAPAEVTLLTLSST